MTATAFVARRHWVAEEGLRLDAGAYAGGALAARDRITDGEWGHEQLSKVASCFYETRFARNYVMRPDRGITFLTASDMLLADLKGLRILSSRATGQLDRLRLQPGWTLISRSGTIGRTVYVRDEMLGMAASDDCIRIVANDAVVAPGYLFAFLSSAPGQVMIHQRTYGSVVQHIEPHHLADIPVPLPNPTDQQRIHDLVADAAAARTEASRLLDEAAAYFDGLVGPMRHLHDHSKAVGIVSRSRMDLRLDAFHHVGWAMESGDIDGTPVAEIATVTRPGIVKRIFVERGVPWVSGIDIFQLRPTYREQIRRADVEAAGCIVEKGQVLVQRSGQRYGLIGRPAFVGSRCHGWAAGEHLIRVTARNPVDAGRIFAFVRSQIGRRALMRSSYGTSIPELNPKIVSELRVPELPNALHDNGRRALDLREQADADEERAIREVEAWLA